VLTTLTRFCQCAGYTVDTGTPFYFCHGMFGVCRTDRLKAVRPLHCRTATL
jgi:hypothetical protein